MHVAARPLRGLRIAFVAVVLAAAASVPASPSATAAQAEDVASDIALVLDFSGSILDDAAVRSSFAGALEDIAARVDETTADLTAGDATVSIVRFATTAANFPGCTGLRLRENEAAVATLAECLRNLAAAYRRGVDPAVTGAIGDDTNYVAAMEQAATHLPADSARPAIIFFTDGRHEAAGVPVSQVIPARDRLFGERSPFALLPVGLGVDPDDRPTLEAGLAQLRVTRDFERCEGGALEWPTVVFESADAAGQAVAVALQDVSCTFTVEPSPTPPPPSPTPSAAPVQGIGLIPGDSSIEVQWAPPADAADNPVTGYGIRCRPTTGGDWIEATSASPSQTSATVPGLENGVDYTCEVEAVRAGGADPWTAATTTATPFGRPPAPLKPSVQALDTAARVELSIPDDTPVTDFRVECSSDGGATWSIRKSAGSSGVADVDGLANGTNYVCRAFAGNDVGVSDASPVSDSFRPCSGILDCNPLALPLLGGLVAILVGAILFGLWRFAAGRRLWVTAQVDNFTPVDLGRGPNVGMAFVRRGPYQRIARVAPATAPDAHVRIKYAGGETFVVRAGKARMRASFGHIVQVPDDRGQLHTLVLRAYDEQPQPLRRPDEAG